MRARSRREPMTEGEREILFEIQKLHAKWHDTLQMCLHRELHHRRRVEELTKTVNTLAQQVQELRQQLGHHDQRSLFERGDSL